MQLLTKQSSEHSTKAHGCRTQRFKDRKEEKTETIERLKKRFQDIHKIEQQREREREREEKKVWNKTNSVLLSI